MKNFNLAKLSMLCMSTLLLTSCDSDDDATPEFEGETIEYSLQPVEEATVEGNVIFIENENGTTSIEVTIEGAEEGESYSPRLLHGSVDEAGELAVTLEDFEEGKSTTSLSKLEDGTEITFGELKEMDGHIVIYHLAEEEEIPVATANIGANVEE